MTPAKGVLGCARDWRRDGHKVAIATVVETWGSAPRPAGSQMVIRDDGHMEGSVSGGCVEGAVIVEALEAMEGGGACLLDYGVSDDEAFAVGLACGGRIRVLVDTLGGSMPDEVLFGLVVARSERRPLAYVADLTTSARFLAQPEDFADRFRLDRSGIEEDGRTFVAIHNPPLRMVVVGGVHIAQHLIPMARACGYDPVLVEPRAAFGTPERFPDTRIVEDWPDEALAQIGLDARTCVVTLTHDAKLDDPAIGAALASDVLYVGCLGSKRTHAKRVKRLEEAGFGASDIARIHGPVGLDIGARSPGEIAVSIVAEVTAVLRKS